MPLTESPRTRLALANLRAERDKLRMLSDLRLEIVEALSAKVEVQHKAFVAIMGCTKLSDALVIVDAALTAEME